MIYPYIFKLDNSLGFNETFFNTFISLLPINSLKVRYEYGVCLSLSVMA
jgi:hypothetical protein